MNKKEKFKNFVKQHPELLNHVKNGKKTWQNFYEMYDIYGEKEEIWNEYLTPIKQTNSFDMLNFLKTIDLDSIEEAITSIQRVLSLFQDMTKDTNKSSSTKKPRPIYKHFED